MSATAVVLVVVLGSGAGSAHPRITHPRAPRGAASSAAVPVARVPARAVRPVSFAVGLLVLHLRDVTRTITLPDGRTEPRPLLTYVRYPALGALAQRDALGAPAARRHGPFPLVVFGHGFAVTPTPYTPLLDAWARAGYVVAAPVFPLASAGAPGGPDETDLVNQPADMRVVISRLLRADAARASPLSGLIDRSRIAVSGQSDGGDTALAVAYDARFRDSRVDAAVILSGAEIPGEEGFAFAPGAPPLLATQGTADTINPPSATRAFFDAARRPKYLLSLTGAEHLPPYTTEQPQLTIVERATIAFLDRYLKDSPGALARLRSVGEVDGRAVLRALP